MSWKPRLAALGIGLLLAPVLAEVAVRAVGVEADWLADLAYFNSVDPEVHQVSDDLDLVFELKPDSTESYRAPDGQQREDEHAWWSDPRVVTVNALGHRDPPRTPAKAEGTFRIACMGGSNTYGAAVSNELTWPAALEAELNAALARPAEAWNLGVSAYVTRQKLGMARRALERYEPDLLLFQMSNTGPRNVLLQGPEATLTAFRRDPRLYRETLLYGPEGPAFWFDKTTLGRVFVMFKNRRVRVDESGKYGRPMVELDGRAERLAEREFKAFLEEVDVPVVVLYPAEGGSAAWLEAVDVPLIDLSAQKDVPDTPDGRHLHPGAEVYRWYGRRIAQYLIGSGCVTSGGCTPHRSWWRQIEFGSVPQTDTAFPPAGSSSTSTTVQPPGGGQSPGAVAPGE